LQPPDKPLCSKRGRLKALQSQSFDHGSPRNHRKREEKFKTLQSQSFDHPRPKLREGLKSLGKNKFVSFDMDYSERKHLEK
jgi:hypothetical protein